MLCDKCKRDCENRYAVRLLQYCETCFTTYLRAKYRKVLDSWRLQLPGEKDLAACLALSGGLPSACLVHMTYTAITATKGRSQMPIVLHIDDSEYRPIDSDRIEWLKLHCPMDYHTRSIAECDDEHILRDAIAGLASSTAQNDMLAIYRNKLINRVAKSLGCQAVYHGDSASSVAAKTLALTIKGRGYALPTEVADYVMVDNVWVVRPFKQILNTELIDYARMIGLPYQPPSECGRPKDIDDLTMRYFAGLEQQFPSLVATVVRTTNKLVEGTDAEYEPCRVCGQAMNTDAKAWLKNITVSRAPNQEEQEETDEKGDLCYGCEVATRGAKEALAWPMMGRNHETKALAEEYSI